MKWLVGTIVVGLLIAGGLFIFFREEMITIGLVKGLESDVGEFIENSRDVVEIYNDPNRTDEEKIKSIEEMGTSSSMLALAKLQPTRECELLKKAVMNENNPAMVEALLGGKAYSSTRCLQDIAYFKLLKFNAETHETNVLIKLREAGIKNPEDDLSSKLYDSLSSIKD